MKSPPIRDNETSPRPSLRRNPSWGGEALSFFLRFIAFGALWWVLAEGNVSSFSLPILFSLAAIAAARVLCPPFAWRWNPVAVVAFIPWFLLYSFLGGVDVALRALRPSMPLRPEVVSFPLEVPEKPALLLAWIVSLLPGTACIYLEPGRLRIHVLDTRQPVIEKTRSLEKKINRLCSG